MPRGPELTKKKIARIASLCEANKSNKEISIKTGIPLRSVQRWATKCRVAGGHDPPLKVRRSGQPRKISEEDFEVLQRQVEAEPGITAKKLVEKNKELLQHMSLRTIQRRLQEGFFYQPRASQRKPILSEKQIQERLEFCRKYLKSDSEEWMKKISGSTSSENTIVKPKTLAKHSQGHSSVSNEREEMLDDDREMKIEIKEEDVDDVSEFANTFDHYAEAMPGVKEEGNMDALAEYYPSYSSSSSSSSLEFVDVRSHQMEIPLDPKEDPVGVLAVAGPSSSTASTSSASLKKNSVAIPQVENADEFHLFAMFVATQLRALPLGDALQAQLEIQTILAQKRTQRLT